MIYPFNCPVHGEFEINMRMADAQSTHACPICGEISPRIYLTPDITFKGGGWASKKPKKIDNPSGEDWVKRRQKEKWI
jgi:putative FmdB family regulatory protein